MGVNSKCGVQSKRKKTAAPNGIHGRSAGLGKENWHGVFYYPLWCYDAWCLKSFFLFLVSFRQIPESGRVTNELWLFFDGMIVATKSMKVKTARS